VIKIMLVLRRAATVLVIEMAATMADAIFDHDRLDVYRLAIQYTAESLPVVKRHTPSRR
jgi:hypothetical protein